MTRRQKLVLIVLAVLNLAVIGAMGSYVVITTRRADTASVDPNPCADALLPRMGTWAASMAVDWSPDAAYVELTHPTPSVANAPADLVWDALDHLPADLAEICPEPDSVTLTVHTGSPATQSQTVLVDGALLLDWLAGRISDDDLAAQARYRIVQVRPGEN